MVRYGPAGVRRRPARHGRVCNPSPTSNRTARNQCHHLPRRPSRTGPMARTERVIRPCQVSCSTRHLPQDAGSVAPSAVTGAPMQRTFLYFAAFTGMAAVFAVAILVTALASARDRASGASPSAIPRRVGGRRRTGGEITITAFDLGFEPAMVARRRCRDRTPSRSSTTAAPRTTSPSPTARRSPPRRHQTATGEVTIPADGMTFICSVPGHADAGMRGEVMVAAAGGSGGAEARPGASHDGGGDARRRRGGHSPVPSRDGGKGQPGPRAGDPCATGRCSGSSPHRSSSGRPSRARSSRPTPTTAWSRDRSCVREVGDHIRIILHNELPEPTTIHFARPVRADTTWTACR